MKQNDRYVCYRPRLAAKLISQGNKPSFEPNPWHPDKTAWTFELTPALCGTVSSYYQDEGKPVPSIITKYLESKGGNADA